jgi:hypothetical protein
MAGVDHAEGGSLLWRDSGEQEMGDNSSALHVQVIWILITVWKNFNLDSVRGEMKFYLEISTTVQIFSFKILHVNFDILSSSSSLSSSSRLWQVDEYYFCRFYCKTFRWIHFC